MNMNESKKKLLERLDKFRQKFKDYFVADGDDNQDVRKKHLRVGTAIVGGIALILIASVLLSEMIDAEKAPTASQSSAPKDTSKKVDIKNLAKGVTHEQTWIEKAEREVLDMKLKQKESTEKQTQLEEYLNKESITKKELGEILKELERRVEDKYASKLAEQQSSHASHMQSPQGSVIESIKNNNKIKVKKIGTYIPAGSYVQAKMISGVDAGIGVMAEADPRQVLLRITGKVISAGFGKKYLTTDKLMGCVVQCQAVGDLSSEKAYLKPVVMTCARDSESVIEIPVKGYAASNGKVGIRGEIVSREGALVTQSFFSGLIGGLGSGVSQMSEPGYLLSGGMASKQSSDIKSVLGGGLGRGVGESSSRLSDYLIKRAEQYQPVISINEGVTTDLVFQEGFSIVEEGE